MKEVDYIIVGQGVGGSILAYLLDKLGYRIICIDNSHNRSASLVSAGIINPITGRRFAYSWRYSEVMEVSKAVYQDMELRFGRTFLSPKTIYRFVPTVEAKNDVEIKFSDPYYKDLIRPLNEQDEINQYSKSDFIAINGYMLDVRSMVTQVGAWLRKKEALIDSDFNYERLKVLSENGVQYGDIHAKAIIFCQGIGILSNPLFEKIPILPYKGQLIIGNIEMESMPYILKKKFFLTRLPFGKYWFGTYDNMECLDFSITSQAEEYLLDGIKEQYGLEFNDYEMQVGVRPTSYDRRPIIGNHKDYSAIMVLNGLGTKGSSLAPYCAQKLIDIMQKKEPLDEALDINRYDYISSLQY